METQTSIKSVNELATLRNSAMSRRSAEKKKTKIDRRKSQNCLILISLQINFGATSSCDRLPLWSKCLLCLSVCLSVCVSVFGLGK